MFKEHLNAMLSDDKAVSPVIGVILMVAVTVILAAVIGAFVLGFGDSLSEPAPDAQIDFDYSASADQLEISHDGGQTINNQNTGFLSVSNAADWAAGGSVAEADWGDNLSEDGTDRVALDDGASFTSGDTILNTGAVADPSGEEVDLVWENSDASNSQELGSYVFP